LSITGCTFNITTGTADAIVVTGTVTYEVADLQAENGDVTVNTSGGNETINNDSFTVGSRAAPLSPCCAAIPSRCMRLRSRRMHRC
jgi:hypothetical protein